jgi:hypothetical protein
MVGWGYLTKYRMKTRCIHCYFKVCRSQTGFSISSYSSFKEGVEHTSASLPGNMASAVQNSQKVTSSRNINERQNRSDLKFGFSAELEKLVNLTMKKDKDV